MVGAKREALVVLQSHDSAVAVAVEGGAQLAPGFTGPAAGTRGTGKMGLRGNLKQQVPRHIRCDVSIAGNARIFPACAKIQKAVWAFFGGFVRVGRGGFIGWLKVHSLKSGTARPKCNIGPLHHLKIVCGPLSPARVPFTGIARRGTRNLKVLAPTIPLIPPFQPHCRLGPSVQHDPIQIIPCSQHVPVHSASAARHPLHAEIARHIALRRWLLPAAPRGAAPARRSAAPPGNL